MNKNKDVLTLILIPLLSLVVGFLSEGFLGNNLPLTNDYYLYVRYFVKNLYILFAIGISVYSYLKIYKRNK